jgi:formate/nitrite transporter FocA (FNT family)
MLGLKRGSESDGIFSELGEVKDLIVAYAKQETIEPIKSLGRYIAMGMAGSMLLSVGLVLLVLAGLRALQTETGSTFDGNWSFAPYLIVVVVAGVLAGITFSRIGGDK